MQKARRQPEATSKPRSGKRHGTIQLAELKRSRLAAWFCTPTGLFTSIVSAATLMSVLAQFTYAAHPLVKFGPAPQDQYVWLSLRKLDERATELGRIKDPIARSEHCIPTSVMARRLDDKLPPDTRIFLNGVLGENNSSRQTTYFFLRTYLFPREVEISLDGRAIQTIDGFEGVPCESREKLRTNGFDVLIRFQTNDTIAVSPLTSKGKLQ